MKPGQVAESKRGIVLKLRKKVIVVPKRQKKDKSHKAKALKEHLGGGGGGRPDVAQGQGEDLDGVESAVAATLAAFGDALT